MLSDIPVETDPRVLVDFRTADDAGVFAWESGPALVQTVDFFTPIVDDPYVYGEIAAANSLSDIYAMGGRPLAALAVAGFPEDLVDAATIAQVFRGGYDTLRRADVVLLGGHTVRDPEIKFGYAVTGAVVPQPDLAKRRDSPRRRADPDQSRSGPASSGPRLSSGEHRRTSPRAPSPECARSTEPRPRPWPTSTSTPAPT